MNRYVNGVLVDCGPSRTTLHAGNLPGATKQRARTKVVAARAPETPPTETFPCSTSECVRRTRRAGSRCWRCDVLRDRTSPPPEPIVLWSASRARLTPSPTFEDWQRLKARRDREAVALRPIRQECRVLEREARQYVSLGPHRTHVLRLSPHTPGTEGFLDDWRDYLFRLIEREAAALAPPAASAAA